MGTLKANREAFGEALVELGRRDPRIVVFDADVCTSTRTSLFREAFPDRFIQMGVAEQNMVSAAAGCSTVANLIPWVSTFGAFASRRALDQVYISVAYPGLNVKINGSYAGIPTGRAGATHQAMEDLAIMRALPGMVVIDPLDAVETRCAVFAATEHAGPVYLRTTRHETRVVFDADRYRFTLGAAVPMRPGDDVTIIGSGIMTALALDAADVLLREGIRARVLHVHTLKPIDERAILSAARETGAIVTVENHSVIGGLGSAVCEVVCARSPVPVRRIGFPDVFGESGDDEAIHRKLGLTVENVVNQARGLVR
jgi:transketolase